MRQQYAQPKALDPEMYLAPEQLDQLREYARAQAVRYKNLRARTDWLIVEILALAGLRAAEVCDLRIADLPVTHKKPCLIVRRGKGSRGRGPKRRSVDISQHLIDIIEVYCRQYRPDAEPNEPLFLGAHGRALHYRVLYNKVRRLGSACGLRVHPHMLRHSAAVKMYGIEHDLLWVQNQLGHEDPRTTTIYAQTLNPAARRQADQMK